MAVLNITPDSFSDGGKLFDRQASFDAILSGDYCRGATILVWVERARVRGRLPCLSEGMTGSSR